MSNSLDGPAVIVDPYSSGAFYTSVFGQVGVPMIAIISADKPPDVYASSFRSQDFGTILVAGAADLSGPTCEDPLTGGH